MDFRGSILRIDMSVVQKFEVNIVPRLEMIESGKLWSLKMWDVNKHANSGAVVDFKQGMK